MFLFSKVKSPWCGPGAHQTRDRPEVCTLLTLVPWPPERKRNWPISPSPVCMKKTQTGEAEPAGREPRPPVNFRDHLLHQQVWEAEARSAAAPLGLGRLSPELEALAARWRVGVSRRNSSTWTERGGRWERALTFQICSLSDATTGQMRFERLHENKELNEFSICRKVAKITRELRCGMSASCACMGRPWTWGTLPWHLTEVPTLLRQGQFFY